MDVLTKQKQKGYWVWDQTISRILGISKTHFVETIPEAVKNLQVDDQTKEQLWLTILILHWLIKT